MIIYKSFINENSHVINYTDAQTHRRTDTQRHRHTGTRTHRDTDTHTHTHIGSDLFQQARVADVIV
jgi:hypothetical protein